MDLSWCYKLINVSITFHYPIYWIYLKILYVSQFLFSYFSVIILLLGLYFRNLKVSLISQYVCGHVHMSLWCFMLCYVCVATGKHNTLCWFHNVIYLLVSGELGLLDEQVYGASAHSDYGMITLLATDGVGGLQACVICSICDPQLWFLHSCLSTF